MENKEKLMEILYSPSTKRAIYYYRNFAVTSEVDRDYKVIRNIHSAPISLEQMKNSFSNQSIKDWEKREI